MTLMIDAALCPLNLRVNVPLLFEEQDSTTLNRQDVQRVDLFAGRNAEQGERAS